MLLTLGEMGYLGANGRCVAHSGQSTANDTRGHSNILVRKAVISVSRHDSWENVCDFAPSVLVAKHLLGHRKKRYDSKA